MQTLSQRKDTIGKTGMIVKRVTVPIGLEELMEGLSREVLLKKPKDLYMFASEYFARLINIREKSNKYRANPVHTIQSVTHMKNLNIPASKKISPTRPIKHLSRQLSIRSKSPVQHRPTQTELTAKRNNTLKSRERKTSTDRKNSEARGVSKIVAAKDLSKALNTKSGTSTGTSSMQSTPREKRQSSVTRRGKTTGGDDKNKTYEDSKRLQKMQKKSKSETIKTALISPTVIGGSTVAAQAIEAVANRDVIKENEKNKKLDLDVLAESTDTSHITNKTKGIDLKQDERLEVINDSSNKIEFNEEPSALDKISLESSLDSDILAKSTNVAEVAKHIYHSEDDLKSIDETRKVATTWQDNEGKKASKLNHDLSKNEKLEKHEIAANVEDNTNTNQKAVTVEIESLNGDAKKSVDMMQNSENVANVDTLTDHKNVEGIIESTVKDSKLETNEPNQENTRNLLPDNIFSKDVFETDNSQDAENRSKKLTDVVQSTKIEIGVESSENEAKLHVTSNDNISDNKSDYISEEKFDEKETELKLAQEKEQNISTVHGISNIDIEDKNVKQKTKNNLENTIKDDEIQISKADGSKQSEGNFGETDSLVSKQKPATEELDVQTKNSMDSATEIIKENVNLQTTEVTKNQDTIFTNSNHDQDKSIKEENENRQKELGMTDDSITLKKEEYKIEAEENMISQNIVNTKSKENLLHDTISETEPVISDKKDSEPKTNENFLTSASVSGAPVDKSAATLKNKGSNEEEQNISQKGGYISPVDIKEEQAIGSKITDEHLSPKSLDQFPDLSTSKEPGELDENQQTAENKVNQEEVINTNHITGLSTTDKIKDNVFTIKMKPKEKSDDDDVLIVSITDNTKKSIDEDKDEDNKTAESIKNIDPTRSADEIKQKENQFFRETEDLAIKEDDKTKINLKDSEIERQEEKSKFIKSTSSENYSKTDTLHNNVSDTPGNGNVANGEFEVEESKRIKEFDTRLDDAKENVKNPLHQNDVTRKIINSAVSKNQPGLIDSPVKQFISSFINNEQLNVFKDREKEANQKNEVQIAVPEETTNKEGNSITDLREDTTNNEGVSPTEKVKVYQGSGLMFSSVKDLLDFDHNNVKNLDSNKISGENSYGLQDLGNIQSLEREVDKTDSEKFEKSTTEDKIAHGDKPQGSLEGKHVFESGKSVNEILETDTNQNSPLNKIDETHFIKDNESAIENKIPQDNNNITEIKLESKQVLEHKESSSKTMVNDTNQTGFNKTNFEKGKETTEGTITPDNKTQEIFNPSLTVTSSNIQEISESKIISKHFGSVDSNKNIQNEEKVNKEISIVGESESDKTVNKTITPTNNSDMQHKDSTIKNDAHMDGIDTNIHNTNEAFSKDTDEIKPQNKGDLSSLDPVENTQVVKIQKDQDSQYSINLKSVTDEPVFTNKDDKAENIIEIGTTINNTHLAKSDGNDIHSETNHDHTTDLQEPKNSKTESDNNNLKSKNSEPQNLLKSHILNSEMDQPVKSSLQKIKSSEDLPDNRIAKTEAELNSNILNVDNSENNITETSKLAISNDEISTRTANKENSDTNGELKATELSQIPSGTNIIQNIISSKISDQKPGVLDTSINQYLNSFLRNEQSHVFHNEVRDQNKHANLKNYQNNKPKEKTKVYNNKELLSNRENVRRNSTESKHARNKIDKPYLIKKERSRSQENVLSNERKLPETTTNSKVRRVRSVGIIKPDEGVYKSRIPTSARRSAGRRPLVRQLETDSKDIEEKLSIKKEMSKVSKNSSPKSSQENYDTDLPKLNGITDQTKKLSKEAETGKVKENYKDINKEVFKENVVTKEDVIIAKTILKGIEGAEKHIELIEEKLIPNEKKFYEAAIADNTKDDNKNKNEPIDEDRFQKEHTADLNITNKVVNMDDDEDKILNLNKRVKPATKEIHEDQPEKFIKFTSEALNDSAKHLLENPMANETETEKGLDSENVKGDSNKKMVNNIISENSKVFTSTEGSDIKLNDKIGEATTESKFQLETDKVDMPVQSISENVVNDATNKTDEAATTIQKSWKGFHVRKDLEQKNRNTDNNKETDKFEDINEHPKREKEDANAAIKIQSFWRGYITRKVMKNSSQKPKKLKTNQEEAILKIQAVVRGYLERLKYKKLKEEHTKDAGNKIDNLKSVTEDSTLNKGVIKNVNQENLNDTKESKDNFKELQSEDATGIAKVDKLKSDMEDQNDSALNKTCIKNENLESVNDENSNIGDLKIFLDENIPDTDNKMEKLETDIKDHRDTPQDENVANKDNKSLPTETENKEAKEVQDNLNKGKNNANSDYNTSKKGITPKEGEEKNINDQNDNKLSESSIIKETNEKKLKNPEEDRDDNNLERLGKNGHGADSDSEKITSDKKENTNVEDTNHSRELEKSLNETMEEKILKDYGDKSQKENEKKENKIYQENLDSGKNISNDYFNKRVENTDNRNLNNFDIKKEGFDVNNINAEDKILPDVNLDNLKDKIDATHLENNLTDETNKTHFEDQKNEGKTISLANPSIENKKEYEQNVRSITSQESLNTFDDESNKIIEETAKGTNEKGTRDDNIKDQSKSQPLEESLDENVNEKKFADKEKSSDSYNFNNLDVANESKEIKGHKPKKSLNDIESVSDRPSKKQTEETAKNLSKEENLFEDKNIHQKNNEDSKEGLAENIIQGQIKDINIKDGKDKNGIQVKGIEEHLENIKNTTEEDYSKPIEKNSKHKSMKSTSSFEKTDYNEKDNNNLKNIIAKVEENDEQNINRRESQENLLDNKDMLEGFSKQIGEESTEVQTSKRPPNEKTKKHIENILGKNENVADLEKYGDDSKNIVQYENEEKQLIKHNDSIENQSYDKTISVTEDNKVQENITKKNHSDRNRTTDNSTKLEKSVCNNGDKLKQEANMQNTICPKAETKNNELTYNSESKTENFVSDQIEDNNKSQENSKENRMLKSEEKNLSADENISMVKKIKDDGFSTENNIANNTFGKSSSDKPAFYRSDTVVEPDMVKKTFSHLGDVEQGTLTVQQNNGDIGLSGKDDNNNSQSKEDTKLESEVRSAVKKIINGNKNMSSLETEIEKAVKNIMENNIDNNESVACDEFTNKSEIKEDTKKLEYKTTENTITDTLSQLPSHETPEHLNESSQQDISKEDTSDYLPLDKIDQKDILTKSTNTSLLATPSITDHLSEEKVTENLKNEKDLYSSEMSADDVSSVDSVDSVVTVVPNVNYNPSIKKENESNDHPILPSKSLSQDIAKEKENKEILDKNLVKKSLSADALEGHVELIDQVQNKLLDQICGKPVDTSSKFDIEQLRKELHEAASLYKGEDENIGFIDHDDELLEYLNDFEPEDDNTYDSKVIRTPIRELPDIEEEVDSSDTETTRKAILLENSSEQGKSEFCKIPSTTSTNKLIDNKPLNDHVEILNLEKFKQGHNQIIIKNDNIQINGTETVGGGNNATDDSNQKLLHSSELHDSVLIPISSSTKRSTLADSGKLKHTSEFHDTLVVPLPSGSDVNIKNEAEETLANDRPTEAAKTETVDTGNQTAFQQSPAGAPIVTSRRSSQDGVDVVEAQASLRDTSSPTKPKSGESLTHQSPLQSPRFVKQDMERKNMEAEAATKIQAGFRGYQVRKQLKTKNAPTDKTGQERQLRRKTSGRKNMKDPDLAEKSAVKIQAGVRGFLVRRRQKKQLNSSASA